MTDPSSVLASLVAVLLALAALWLWRRARRAGRVAPRRVPQGRGPTILVDGSNVMHWNRDPSAQVLARVVQRLQDAGERPHVWFDANAGYKLAGRYLGPAALGEMIGLPATRVSVADSGTPADPLLLAHATRSRLRVVSNDQFRDWRVQFPHTARKGALVRGRWQDGTPLLRL